MFSKTFSLSLCHTIPTLNDPKEKSFKNTAGKGENSGNKQFLLFPAFSTLSRREIIILTKSILSSANASNLDQVKILSFGKELRDHINCGLHGKGLSLSQTTKF